MPTSPYFANPGNLPTSQPNHHPQHHTLPLVPSHLKHTNNPPPLFSDTITIPITTPRPFNLPPPTKENHYWPILVGVPWARRAYRWKGRAVGAGGGDRRLVGGFPEFRHTRSGGISEPLIRPFEGKNASPEGPAGGAAGGPKKPWGRKKNTIIRVQ